MPVAQLKETEPKKKILIIEDDRNLREALRYNFLSEGFEVHACDDGIIGLRSATEWGPDIVILDLMLPGIGGIEICRSIRREGLIVPVIILTAKDSEVDRVVGLEIGADDYVTKPFSMRELMARVRNALRRANEDRSNGTDSNTEKIVAGNLEIDLSSHIVRLSDSPVEMKPREFSLLFLLASNPGRVYTRDQILEGLWGQAYIGDIRTVDVHVRWIREKIEDDPSQPTKIVTVRGVGYRFDG